MTKQMADKIAQDFKEYMTEWHSHNQPYDDKMDADLHERYARVLREQSKWGYFDFQKNPQGIRRPHFGPSSAGYSDREMYEKARKAKRDKPDFTVNQRYWVGLGGEIGAYMQREIMLADRHYEKLTGNKPKFRMKRKDNGDPMYEHFVKTMHEIEYDGQHFAYFGLPDGILEYLDDGTGEIKTVGLELKSEQSNWSKFKSLDEPKHGHLAQTTAYSDMYGFDYVIVAYVLSYGRGWFEDFNRLKTFGAYVTEDDRNHLRQRCADSVKQAKEGTPPKLGIDEWKFNDYKGVIAKDLTGEEVADLERTVEQAKHSSLPGWKIASYQSALDDIKERRDD